VKHVIHHLLDLTLKPENVIFHLLLYYGQLKLYVDIHCLTNLFSKRISFSEKQQHLLNADFPVLNEFKISGDEVSVRLLDPEYSHLAS